MTENRTLDEPSIRVIGGVFPLEPTSPNSDGQSILSAWSGTAAAVYLFHNARSAMHHVFSDLARDRIWLPAYLCPEILQAVSTANHEVHYYPLDEKLNPKIDFLSDHIKAGDVVVGINYFGRPAGTDLCNLAKNHPDVIWVEDCAHMIDPGLSHFSDIQIYSPRKLLGVPDGGVLVDRNSVITRPSLTGQPGKSFLKACQIRAKGQNDKNDQNRKAWFQAFRKSEEMMAISTHEISDISRNILENATIASVINRRAENYAFLRKNLNELPFFKQPISWTPFGFPIISMHCEQLSSHLSKHKIFSPRHWQKLTAPITRFPLEHMLSERLITIPCDQRYDIIDMERIVSVLRAFVK